MEHHERADGAGFPARKSGDALDKLGQIIALTDMLYSLRFKELVLNAATLQDCMPFLRVNTKSYTEENYRAISSILRRAKPTEEEQSSGSTSDLASKVQSANDIAIKLLEPLKELQEHIAENANCAARKSIAILLSQIQSVIHSSGSNTEELASWLKNAGAATTPETVQELTDLHTTYHEIFWLGKRINRHLTELHEKEEDSTLNKLEQSIQEHIEKGWALYN